MHRCLVTGGSKGIGLAVCKLLPSLLPLELFIVSRTAPASLTTIRDQYPESRFHHIACDLSKGDSLNRLLDDIASISPGFDLLVNNAGMFSKRGLALHSWERALRYSDVASTLHLNFIAPTMLTQAVLPNMAANSFGRIVNVSSGMSRADEYGAHGLTYRASKRALNGLTMSTSIAVKDVDISCVSVCPGWVRTDMGGSAAVRSPEEAALGIVWALLSPDTSISGGFYRDGAPLNYETTSSNDHLDHGPPPTFHADVAVRAQQFWEKYSS